MTSATYVCYSPWDDAVIIQLLQTGHVSRWSNLDSDPVRARETQTECKECAVLGESCASDGCGPVLRQLVGVKKHLRVCVQCVLHVENTERGNHIPTAVVSETVHALWLALEENNQLSNVFVSDNNVSILYYRHNHVAPFIYTKILYKIFF